MQFEKLLERLAIVLDRMAVPYMVIGGQAVLVHGEPRLTKDIDVTLGLEPFDPVPLLNVVAKLQLQVLVPNPAEFLKETFVLPALDTDSGIRVDLICSLSDYERGAIDRGLRITMGSASVNFIGLEDLLVHKLIAGRPRDLEDARAILLKNRQTNIAEVGRWLDEHDNALGTEFRERLEKLLAELRSTP